MPVHDWTRVDAGLFHAFHQRWISALCDALNTGGLPPDYFALPEQRIRGPITDVLTLKLAARSGGPSNGATGLAVAAAPPRARLIRRSDPEVYARKADRIAVRHRHGDVVAVIEIVSPGNKASRAEFRDLVEKSATLIQQGVHLLVIDLFPPGPRDPHGLPHAIWDEFDLQDLTLPPDKPLSLAACDAAVTERGQNLSGGQRQRLAIACILLKRPQVLILDEATSALDNISERYVQRALGVVDSSRTTILVAHRLSTLRDADRIFVFDDGRVVEVGTYAELVQRGGVFAELVMSAENGLTADGAADGAEAVRAAS